MSRQHQFRTFAENELGYVGLCACCRTVNVAFQNSLFCLALNEFDGFCNMIHDRTAMRPCCTSHGKERMMITPTPNYFLLFSETELDYLSTLLAEARPILEAERILTSI